MPAPVRTAICPPCAAPRRAPRQRAPRLLLPMVLLALLVGCDSGPDAPAFVEQAAAAEESGDLRGAVIQLKNALQNDPEHREARWRLGRIYLQLGQGDAAQKELERAQQLGMRSDELTLSLLRARLLQGQFREVLGQTATVSVDSDPQALQLLRGEAQLGLRELDAAQTTFEAVLAAQPNSLEAQRGLARVALSRRDLGEADRLLGAALENASEDVQSLLLKGELELSRGNYESALEAFDAAAAAGTEAPAMQLGRVRALLGLDRVEEATAVLDGIQSGPTDNPLINYFRGVAAHRAGNLEAAHEALREVLRVQPNHTQSLLLMGSIQYAREEYRQAEEHLGRFVAQAPTHVPGRKLLAAVHMRLEQPAEAVRTLEPVLESAGEDPQFLAMLGSAYLGERQFQRGTEMLERAAALDPSAAAIRTQLALSQLATGASDAAMASLQSAVQMDPAFTRADLLLIFAHLRQQEWDAAISSAEALLVKQPDNPVPLNLLGAAYAGKGDLAEARAQYEKALAVQPDYAAANLNLAALDAQAGEMDTAVQRYEAVLDRDPRQVQASMALAQIAGRGGDVDEAMRLLEQARLNNPEALPPRLTLLSIYLRQRRADEAFALAEESARLAPDNALVKLGLGQAHALQGDLTRARSLVEEVAREQPGSADVRYQLAQIQMRAGDPEAARESLEAALEINAAHYGARVALGDLEVRTGNVDAALAIAASLEESNADDPAAAVLRGDAHMRASDATTALASYQRAFEAVQNSALVMKMYSAMRAEERGDEARVMLERWLEEHPDDVTVRLALASIDQSAGAASAAASNYERLLQAQPSNAVAHNNLAWIYHDAGDPRALTHAERAYELAPQVPAIADTYGWFLVQDDKLEQGLVILERAARGAPQSMEIQYHLAAALARAGDLTRARQILEVVIASDQPFATRGDAEELFRTL